MKNKFFGKWFYLDTLVHKKSNGSWDTDCIKGRQLKTAGMDKWWTRIFDAEIKGHRWKMKLLRWCIVVALHHTRCAMHLQCKNCISYSGIFERLSISASRGKGDHTVFWSESHRWYTWRDNLVSLTTPETMKPVKTLRDILLGCLRTVRLFWCAWLFSFPRSAPIGENWDFLLKMSPFYC